MSYTVLENFDNNANLSDEAKKMFEKVEELDYTFQEFIKYYPEAYAKNKVYDLKDYSVQNVIFDVNRKMKELNEKLKKIEETHDADIKDYNKEGSELQKIFFSLAERLEQIIPPETSAQLKQDKITLYRTNIVKMIFLISGIGIISGSIYHLIK